MTPKGMVVRPNSHAGIPRRSLHGWRSCQRVGLPPLLSHIGMDRTHLEPAQAMHPSPQSRSASTPFGPLPFALLAILLATSGCREPPRPPPTFDAVQLDLLGAPGTLTNAWADFDGDVDPDLFVGFNGAPNRLYRNDGGILVDVASEVGVADTRSTRTSAWGDFDSDGDPDLFLGFAPGEEPVTRLYRNDGATFVDVASELGLQRQEGATRQASWADFDADGDLDLFLAFRDRPNALFLNEGGVFQDVAEEVGLADPRRSVGALWFDFEEDGDLDLLVTNMDGDANGLFRNQGGLFTDVAAEVGLAEGGRGLGDETHGSVRPCVADVDNDGAFEVFFANYGPNGLFKKEPGGRWRNVGPEQGLAIDGRYDSCEFGDFDSDGRIDLYVNGTVTGGTQYRDYLFRNTSEGFIDATPPDLFLDADHGVRWVDLDQDGALDLSLTGATDSGMHYVLLNHTSSALETPSLQVQVTDGTGLMTRAGAEVRIYAAGTQRLLGTRLLDTGSGYDSQSSLPVHFGLPGNGPVDIEVVFPGGGNRTTVVVREVDPRDHRGRPLTVILPG